MKRNEPSFYSKHKKEIWGAIWLGILVVVSAYESMDDSTSFGCTRKDSEDILPPNEMDTSCISDCNKTGMISRSPHSVSPHVRNLPAGRVASQFKKNSALDNGFILLDNQTWIQAYTTGKI